MPGCASHRARRRRRYAKLTVADERFCLPLPGGLGDGEAASLPGGGLIGHRALRMVADARPIGLYEFGSASQMICQVAVHQGREVYAFTRPGDTRSQEFARMREALRSTDRGGGVIWRSTTSDPAGSRAAP